MKLLELIDPLQFDNNVEVYDEEEKSLYNGMAAGIPNMLVKMKVLEISLRIDANKVPYMSITIKWASDKDAELYRQYLEKLEMQSYDNDEVPF